jgi:hypothetical protein
VQYFAHASYLEGDDRYCAGGSLQQYQRQTLVTGR